MPAPGRGLLGYPSLGSSCQSTAGLCGDPAPPPPRGLALPSPASSTWRCAHGRRSGVAGVGGWGGCGTSPPEAQTGRVRETPRLPGRWADLGLHLLDPNFPSDFPSARQSCPDGARDFRAEQCTEFDGVEFQGRRYRWLPYYGEVRQIHGDSPNKCELNCIPKGENFYYKHREAVVDGTPCEPGKRDVCVDGSCRVVGCDHQLDSSKQEDKCLQCGGDGTTCYPVTGTFDANDLSRGGGGSNKGLLPDPSLPVPALA
ncbi:hypothetical protein P7K49_018287 [Saguinus oedipus]|uniref:ADAMTS/ADAMTS-like cysteine-rich domain-containing protein n=1 Tax=Saguinus oedipus TaxID=9490 RepID=A0ABQ9V5A9_SAGOE|nr:hypothetical protein P7K49_018287 [Saguinus oedipus]